MELNRGVCSPHYCSLFTLISLFHLLRTGSRMEAFSYVDYVTLLTPTSMALKAMLNTCTEFAASHNLLFNASKQNACFLMVPDRKHIALLNSRVRQLILLRTVLNYKEFLYAVMSKIEF